MKSYSYIRENVYKVLHPWNKDDESGILAQLHHWALADGLTHHQTCYSSSDVPTYTLHHLVSHVHTPRRSCSVVCWPDGASGWLLFTLLLFPVLSHPPVQRQLPQVRGEVMLRAIHCMCKYVVGTSTILQWSFYNSKSILAAPVFLSVQ